jgi:hypothetical protein
MCCGNKRMALRNISTSSRAASSAPAPAAAGVPLGGAPRSKGIAPAVALSARGPSNSVMLRYKDASAIRVRGPVTGRLYDFSAAQPAQPVDPLDAPALTRSGLLHQA